MSKPKICMIVDRIGWAYDVIARALETHLKEYDFAIVPAHKISEVNRDHAKYDLIFSMGWKWPHRDITTPQHKTVGVCHSFRTLGAKHTIEEWCKYMTDRYCAVGAVNQRLVNMLSDYIPDMHYTPNGVDENRFVPGPKRQYGKITAGWSGRGDDLAFRGVPIMEHACEQAGWDLKLNIAEKTHIQHEDMPEFYQCLDVYFCLSQSEGCSCSMLEAAACGIPILCTDTGVAQEMVRHGGTGYVFDRNELDASAEALIECMRGMDRRKCHQMGEDMRTMIENSWTWKVQAQLWKKLIDAGLGERTGR